MSNSSQSTRPTGQVLWKELLKDEGEKSEGETSIFWVLTVKSCKYQGCSYETDWVNIILAVIWGTLYAMLHITPLWSLLYTLLKDKCMSLQDECKLYVTRPSGQVQYWNIFVPWITNILFESRKRKVFKFSNIYCSWSNMLPTWTLSPSLHIWGGSTMLRSGPTCIVLSIYCTDPIPPVAPLMWCEWCGSAVSEFLHRNTVKVTSPFRMSKSQVITQPRWGTCINTWKKKR